MATIAVGDIHGNRLALNDILVQIRSEAAAGDTIVFLGDYIDRGPDTKGCVDAILGLQREVKAEVVCLLGNHEDWFLRTLRDYRSHSWLLGMEAFDTMRSYSVEAARTLREAVSKAGAGVYLERCALPYEAFFDCVPKSTFDSWRVCVSITRVRIACAHTAGWIPASLVFKNKSARP